MVAFRRSNVSSTGNGLDLLTMPSTEGGVPDVVASFIFLTFLVITSTSFSRLLTTGQEEVPHPHVSWVLHFHCSKYRRTRSRKHWASVRRSPAISQRCIFRGRAKNCQVHEKALSYVQVPFST